MEIDVTEVMSHDLRSYFDSIANSGLSNIAEVTWRNACAAVGRLESPLVTVAQQGELRAWLLDFGAWDEEEIGSMSDIEMQALLLQFVASEGIEYLEAEEEDCLEEWAESFGCRLYEYDGNWYFLVGV